MKNIMFLFCALFTFCCADAQKYVHYYMNDSTFNGFYTSMSPEIKHDPSTGTTTILLNGNEHNVPVQNIDKIEIEDALVTDSFIGDYRIYEGAFEDQEYKYAFVDTRAHLLASKNGDFGANDTILFASVYNNEQVLFFTNENGKIQKIFDGNSLFFYDYADDVLENVIELTSDGGMVEHPEMVRTRSRISIFKPISTGSVLGDFLADSYLNLANYGLGQFINNINEFRNNPENHQGNLIVDGMFIAGDIVGVAGAFAAGISTGGLAWAGLGIGIVGLGNDIWGLMNDIFPSSEQMEKYKEYYQNKYNITVKTIDPKNVKSDKADIRGTFSSSKGIKGNLYFSFSKLTDTGMGNKITGSAEEVSSQSYIVKGEANDLKPGTNYFYMLYYECDVNGLHFTYAADNGIDFKTSIPAATTFQVDAEDVKDRTATVKCSFSNVPNGATCGVQYGSDGSSSIATTSSSDGEKTVNLTGLKPATTYSYRAFIQYEGQNYYGETLSFTTDFPDISGTWNCKETHYRPSGTEYYTTYTITLGEDGTVQTTATASEILKSSWSLSTDGEVNISIVDIATQTTNSGVEWKGNVDSMENPTKITGYTNRWNFNTIGYFGGDSYVFEMTR